MSGVTSGVTSAAYERALGRIFGLARFGEKLDLSTPRALNEALGDPLACYRSVLIGGTNGKGSTGAFLEALLKDAGLKVGLFTSPHLVSFRERIRVDGAQIAEDSVCRGVGQVFERAAEAGIQPSFFEAAWGLAAWAFAEAELDVVIWEVGLGGRLDATNTCTPVASAITTIGLDHTHILGDTLEAIAVEKAGIFRAGVPALTGATGPGLKAVREAWPEVCLAGAFEADLPLPGAHMQRNAGLALALASSLGISPRVEALQGVRWPGRGELLDGVLLDCAHNGHAAEAFCEWLSGRFDAPIHLIFGAMQGKDLEPLAAPLRALADSVTVVTPKYPRRREASELLPLFPGARLVDDVAEALASRPAGAQTVVVGSCFLVGEARAALLGVPFPEAGIITLAR